MDAPESAPEPTPAQPSAEPSAPATRPASGPPAAGPLASGPPASGPPGQASPPIGGASREAVQRAYASPVRNGLDLPRAQRTRWPEVTVSEIHFRPQRRTLLPAVLFLATCCSTFWVGAAQWEPMRPDRMATWGMVLHTIQRNWTTGLQYMCAVVGILVAHEMGHFWQTVKHRIPASYPLCIPVPFNPIGTMGAVIGMDGLRADRRQIFDIGIGGPLAGLAIAFPVFWYGISQLNLAGRAQPEEFQLYLPLAGQWMLQWAHPEAAWKSAQWAPLSQINPFFMAGWVGMLITGLNMLPISQLDGGHTIYALFLDRAHRFAKMFVSFAIFYVVVNLDDAVLWVPMLVLVIFMGIHHPPTANDDVELGPVRWAIGLASLTIPVLCFPLMGLRVA